MSQWLFAVQMPKPIIEAFINNQIDGYALLALTAEDLGDMLESEDESRISSILAHIKKLKIIWFKTLKQAKRVDEFKDVLAELGILA